MSRICQVYIYGAGENGRLLGERIYEVYNGQIEVLAYLDAYKKGELSGAPIINPFLENVQKEIPVIISVGANDLKLKIGNRLAACGFENIYVNVKKTKTFSKDFFRAECKKMVIDELPVLPYVELHVSDCCNVNCKGCSHFSPVFERKFPDKTKRLKDVEKLRELFSDILQIRLMGGEPLMNTEICEYVAKTRAFFPNADLRIVTNGILIPKMDKTFWRCLKENAVAIDISPYKPTMKLESEIEKTLEENRMDYYFNRDEVVTSFMKPLTKQSHEVQIEKCSSRFCTNVCDGKISRCPQAIYIHQLNVVFGTQFPEDGSFVLDAFNDGNKLLEELQKCVPLCSYCTEVPIAWEQCVGKPKEEDFCV